MTVSPPLENAKPAFWFWILSVVALLWNLFGLFAFVTQLLSGGDEVPTWVMAAFGVAVIGGSLGCVALLI